MRTIQQLILKASTENAKAAPLRNVSLDMTQRGFVLDVHEFTRELDALSTRIDSIRQKLEESK